MTAAHDQLRSFVERIERLEEEKRSLSSDVADLYREAKSNGYDVKALREIIRMRKVAADERQARQAIVETYMQALGMLAELPLGQAAISRATESRTTSLTKPATLPRAEGRA